ncbi:TonB-dependent receptor [bacterium]|nr:TonB-dependent receptor [bacterium]
MNSIKAFAWILILSMIGARAWGQETEDPQQKAKPVVITVSAQAIPESSVSASVTVISREMIEASKAENVIDLLQGVPFLHISQTGGAGGLSAVMLRGGDPNFTFVMIDGIPVNDPTNLLGGSYDFSYLSTDQIERIEIVRGPLSSVFGSEAISGVMNIVSRKGAGPLKLFLEARAGNFGSQEVRTGIQGQHLKWSYAFSGSYFDIDEQTAQDTLNRKTAALFSSLDLGTGRVLNFTTRYTGSDASGFPENGGGPLFSILRAPEKSESEELVLGVRYQQPAFEIDFDFFEHWNDSATPAILDGIPPGVFSLPSFENKSDFERTRIQATGFWTRSPWSATISASWKRESGNSEGIIAEVFPTEFQLQRDTLAGAGEILYDSGNLHATFGIRVDDSENFSEEVSPRFGATYFFPNAGTRIRGTWGEGYKLPSFFAISDPNIGNPDLLPERSRGWDIGVEKEFLDARLFVSGAWFHNSFRDLIDFSSDEFRLVNRREVISKGAEVEARFRATHAIQFLAHLNYVDADIRDSTEPLRDRPKWRGGLGLDWQLTDAARLHLRYTAVGKRFDFQIPVPERSVAGEYQTLDLAASYQILDSLAAFLRVDNLLDHEFQEFIGFPNSGIYARAGISLSFEP